MAADVLLARRHVHEHHSRDSDHSDVDDRSHTPPLPRLLHTASSGSGNGAPVSPELAASPGDHVVHIHRGGSEWAAREPLSSAAVSMGTATGGSGGTATGSAAHAAAGGGDGGGTAAASAPVVKRHRVTKFAYAGRLAALGFADDDPVVSLDSVASVGSSRRGTGSVSGDDVGGDDVVVASVPQPHTPPPPNDIDGRGVVSPSATHTSPSTLDVVLPTSVTPSRGGPGGGRGSARATGGPAADDAAGRGGGSRGGATTPVALPPVRGARSPVARVTPVDVDTPLLPYQPSQSP